MFTPAAQQSNQVAQKPQGSTLHALLQANKKNIQDALPKHLTLDRVLAIAMTEARKNPALLTCTQNSFIGAIIQAAQLGLEPGGHLGHAYLVPFKNKRKNIVECQLIIGFKGFIDLAGRSSRCSRVIARTVRDGDVFDFEFGNKESITHRPAKEQRGDITYFYATLFLSDGSCIFDVMSQQEMQKFRKDLNPREDSPWWSDYEEMGKKTLIRRLFKYAPVSVEIQRAVGLDEAGDRGAQNNAGVIETDGREIPEAPPEGSQTGSKMLSAAAEARQNSVTPTAGKEAPQQQPISTTQATDPGAFQLTDDPAADAAMTDQEVIAEISDHLITLDLSAEAMEADCKKLYKKSPDAMSKAQQRNYMLILRERVKKGQSK